VHKCHLPRILKGTVANDGTGDTLRAAADKINTVMDAVEALQATPPGTFDTKTITDRIISNVVDPGGTDPNYHVASRFLMTLNDPALVIRRSRRLTTLKSIQH
jgi:hypothetical protein